MLSEIVFFIFIGILIFLVWLGGKKETIDRNPPVNNVPDSVGFSNSRYMQMDPRDKTLYDDSQRMLTELPNYDLVLDTKSAAIKDLEIKVWHDNNPSGSSNYPHYMLHANLHMTEDGQVYDSRGYTYNKIPKNHIPDTIIVGEN